MLELQENEEEKELPEDPELAKKRKKSKKKKNRNRSKDKDNNSESEEDLSDEDEDDEDDRQAAFFARRKGKEEDDADSDQSIRDRLLGASPEEQESNTGPEGLTEAEIKDAVAAIIDGLSRELRGEYDESVESSLDELEAVAAASFVDTLRDKVEADDQDITVELLDAALHEALEDLLVVGDEIEQSEAIDGVELQVVQQNVDTNAGQGAHIVPNQVTTGGGSNGNQGNNGGGDPHDNGGADDTADKAISAFVAANSGVNSDKLVGTKNKRGKGLLVGGVVGYIVGSRHGRKRTVEKLQPEVDKLEDQVAELYDALSSREYMMRHVVRELAARELGGAQADSLVALGAHEAAQAPVVSHEASRKIDSPSLVIPAVFATLLISARLKADTANEQNTWGKDFLVGGVAGYMIGRRRGRQQAETQIQTEMEYLEEQIAGLKGDVVNKDAMINAMMRVTSEAGSTIAEHEEGAGSEPASDARGKSVAADRISAQVAGAESKNAVPAQERKLVDSSIDKIAMSRKSREHDKHAKHLVESGKAAAVGGFNLLSSVELERRLMDGTENSSARKQIEVMDEDELLAMSQDIYVDGESAVDLYDNGRVELEVLRKSVVQFWRKTGDYEQTLRTNLGKDESAVNDIRTNLEKAYRSILENV